MPSPRILLFDTNEDREQAKQYHTRYTEKAGFDTPPLTKEERALKASGKPVQRKIRKVYKLVLRNRDKYTQPKKTGLLNLIGAKK